MNKKKTIWLNLVFIIVAFVITIGCVATGAYIQQGHSVTVGQPSDQRFKAPIEVENKVACTQNKHNTKPDVPLLPCCVL